MTGLRIKLTPDGAGGVRPGTVCADGKAIGEVCGCEACPICCGTGNQCLQWERRDAVLLADDAEVVRDVADIPYFNRVNGWTRLGTAFDVVVAGSATYAFDNGAGFNESASITLEPRRIRFRLGPFNATNAELIDLFGATTNEEGVWKTWSSGGPNSESVMNTWRAADNPLGYERVEPPCSQWYYDEGTYTGTHTYENNIGESYSATADNGIADDLNIVSAGGIGQMINMFPPLPKQSFVSLANPDPIGPILCDGLLWGVAMPFEGGPGVTPFFGFPLSQNFGHPSDTGDVFRSPWQAADVAERSAAELTFYRIGGSFSASAAGGSYTGTVTVDHGESMSASWNTDDQFIGGGSEQTVASWTMRLERIPEAACPAYDDLPANACDPPDWTNRVGRECGNPSRVVIFDPATRPTPVEDWPTFLHTADPPDDIERRYLATDEPSPLAAETVTWTEDPCPEPVPARCFADICNPLDIGPDRPARLVYAVNPVLGAGNGRVRLTLEFPNPACPDRPCIEWIEYRPTDEETDDPETPATSHLPGKACPVPSRYGRCVGCLEPIPIPALMEGAMAMGVDPMAAQMRHFGGGCCG